MSARDYLAGRKKSEDHHAALSYVEGLSEPEGTLSEVFEEAEYEVALAANPRLPPLTYLIIRLSGHKVDDGGVDNEVATDILGPISSEIAAAGGSHSPETEVQLVRITKGSLVLHYQAKRPIAQRDQGQIDLEVSPIDRAVRDTFALHTMLEQRVRPSAISNRFGNNRGLLKKARKLTEALDKHDLNMGGRWRSPAGGRASSQLTEVGRAHARSIFAQIDKPDQVVIAGRITALDLEGVLTVRQDGGKKRRIHLPDPSVMLSGQFSLGSTVSVLVEIVEARDQVGLASRETLTYVGPAPHEGTLLS